MVDQYLPTNINAPKRPRTVAADAQLTLDNELILADSTLAPFSLTLPSATVIPGFGFTIKAPAANVNPVTVLPLGGETIDGAPSVAMTGAQQSLVLESDGSGWQITASSPEIANALDVSYTPVAPDPSLNVQNALDWRARHIGNFLVISNYNDLEFFFPAVGGVHTVTAIVLQTGDVLLPASTRIFQTNGTWFGDPGEELIVSGDTPGAAIFSGDPLRIDSITIIQSNATGTAIDATSTSSDSCIIRNIIFRSPAGSPVADVGACHDSLGNFFVEGVEIREMTNGLVFTGTIGGARIFDITAVFMPAGSSAVIFDALCTVLAGVALQDSAHLTGFTNQFLALIDAGVTLPAGQVGIRIQGCSIVPIGARGAILDPAGLAASDIRILLSNNLNGIPSLFLGIANFLVGAVPSPIIKTYSAANTFEPFRRSNGGAGSGNEILLLATSERFSLETPGADPPGEWYLRYLGPLDSVAARIMYQVSFAASATSSNLIFHAEFRITAGGSWTQIPGTTVFIRQINNEPNSAVGFGSIIMSPDYHFRITVSNDNAAASTEIFSVNLTVQEF